MYTQFDVNFGGLDMVYDIYRPFFGAPWRTVFCLHGAWMDGDENSGQALSHGLSLVPDNMMVVSVRCRMPSEEHPEYRWPYMFCDLERAIDHVTKAYGSKIKNIGLLGASAGAHLAAQYGTPYKIPCCCLYGPYNLADWQVTNPTLANQYLPEVFGNVDFSSPGVSPYYRADNLATFPSMFLIHGDEDTSVPVSQTQEYATKINSKHPGAASVLIVQGGEHCLYGDITPSMEEVNQQISSFFQQVL